jgi:hypothetical protein
MMRIMDAGSGYWEKSCGIRQARQLHQPGAAGRPGSPVSSALQGLPDLLQRSRIFDRGQIPWIPAFTEGLD